MFSQVKYQSVVHCCDTLKCRCVGNRGSRKELLASSTAPMAKEGSSLRFGWFGFRPEWLQFLNTPRWFLFFLCQYFFTQSTVVNGVYPGSVSTIERRFGFTRYDVRLLVYLYIHILCLDEYLRCHMWLL